MRSHGKSRSVRDRESRCLPRHPGARPREGGSRTRVDVLERLSRAGWEGAIGHLERATWTRTSQAGGGPDEDWY